MFIDQQNFVIIFSHLFLFFLSFVHLPLQKISLSRSLFSHASMNPDSYNFSINDARP